MINKNPSPEPLFKKEMPDEDIFEDREEALKKYRKRLSTAIKGKKVERS